MYLSFRLLLGELFIPLHVLHCPTALRSDRPFLLGLLGPQVPHSTEDGCCSQMHNTNLDQSG